VLRREYDPEHLGAGALRDKSVIARTTMPARWSAASIAISDDPSHK
jgi:hypothetical protein